MWAGEQIYSMMEFLLYTVFSLLATACLAKILYFSIQPGQWLDSLLGWQNKLRKWDLSGNQFAAKIGGYCEMCFCHAISFLSFWVYCLFMREGLGMWPTFHIDSIILSVIVNVVWYIAYVSIGTNAGLYFLTKLFNK